MLDILRGLAGLLILVGIGWLFSADRKAIDWKLAGMGLLLQLLLGLMIYHVPGIKTAFQWVSGVFTGLLRFSLVGAELVFGDLARNSYAADGVSHNMGMIFAFHILPTIIFFSTLTSALYHLGLLQRVVRGMAWAMMHLLRLTGRESLAVAGNVFLGQTEAPLLIKPYLKSMSKSELNCLMTGGMATIAGGVLAAYIGFLGGESEAERTAFAAHLLGASLMSAPAAVVFAKMLYPERESFGNLDRQLSIHEVRPAANLLDAMTNGATDGVKLALNVGGMLIAFVAVIAMVNYILQDGLGALLGLNGLIADHTAGQFDGLTMEYVLGQAFRPLAWMIGINWQDTLLVGSMLGTKTVLNEFIAYEQLATFKNQGLLSQKSILITTYALCGFSNFGSIAIQIGGIGGLAPSQQSNLSLLGFRALLGATLACLSTATLAGFLAY